VKEGRFIGERRGTAKPQERVPTPEEEAERARQQAEARAMAARQAAEREARVAAAAQAGPERDAPVHTGDPDQEATTPPPSDAVEPEKGAVPAREQDAADAARFPGTQPGAAATAAPGGHESGDTGAETVGPETAGEPADPQGGAAGLGQTDGSTGSDDRGVDPAHPKTDDTE
jgi:hypothetical protein